MDSSKRTRDETNVMSEGGSSQVKKTRISPPIPESIQQEFEQDGSGNGEPEVTEGSSERTEKQKGKKRDASGFQKSRKGKEKNEKNVGRRRGTRTNDSQPTAEIADGEEGEKQARLPKRFCALMIGYSGTGFNGMQIQPTVRTIEGTLFEALVKCGAISKDNSDDPVKVALQRAARTDAGVHAAGNVVSMKIIMDIPGVDNLVARVNEELPPEIRLWDMLRVQGSFNARKSCDSRRYTYFFPTYLLIPPKPGSGLFRTFHGIDASTTADIDRSNLHPFWRESDPNTMHEEDMARKRRFRASPEEISVLREAVRLYEGTHNFHNFTVGRDFKDRSNQRHLKKIEISDPTVYGETEWVSVMLHGQSFMLHQRKMMCALVLACRTGTPSKIINELYGPRLVLVPKMPSLGLLLESPIFESYNARVKNMNGKLNPSHPDARLPINFDSLKDKIEEFKNEQIYKRMRTSEEKSLVFDRWIRSIDSYAGPDLTYFNPSGEIPDRAVRKLGESRGNPFREKRLFDSTDFTSAKSLKDAAAMDSGLEGEQEADEEEEVEGEGVDKQTLIEMEG